jgi:hypothetical protein
MTLTEIRDALTRAAIDFRQHGHNCCAIQAELTALRLTEALEVSDGT